MSMTMGLLWRKGAKAGMRIGWEEWGQIVGGYAILLIFHRLGERLLGHSLKLIIKNGGCYFFLQKLEFQSATMRCGTDEMKNKKKKKKKKSWLQCYCSDFTYLGFM